MDLKALENLKPNLWIFILCDCHLRYELNRAAAIDAEEKADEDFVRSIFSKNGDVKVSLGSGIGAVFTAWIREQDSGSRFGV